MTMRGDCGLSLVPDEALSLLLRSRALTDFLGLTLSGSGDRALFVLLLLVDSNEAPLLSESTEERVITVAVESMDDVRDNVG